MPYGYLEKYPELLEDLEANSAGIGVISISMTNASLEEVFLKYIFCTTVIWPLTNLICYSCDPDSELPAQQESIVLDETDQSFYVPLEGINYSPL